MGSSLILHYIFLTFFISLMFFCETVSARNSLSTHIVDISEGKAVPDVNIELYSFDTPASSWQLIKQAKTTSRVSIRDYLMTKETDLFLEGTYKLVFLTNDYFERKNQTTFYPSIEVAFKVTNSSEHYHVQLLISAYGYSTYRGNL